jgi:hypothetical protein
MDHQFTPYTVIMNKGAPLSPTEDLHTAIIAATQAQALGQSVARIERGDSVVLEGEELKEAIARRTEDAPYC